MVTRDSGIPDVARQAESPDDPDENHAERQKAPTYVDNSSRMIIITTPAIAPR